MHEKRFFTVLAAGVLCCWFWIRSGSPQISDDEPAAAQAQNLTVTLLGTGGGPPVSLQRVEPSTLVEARSEKLLFDCGRGLALRLTQAGKPLDGITKLFLTHLHSDHVIDIPDLFLSPGVGNPEVGILAFSSSGLVSPIP